jgi:alpha-L-arabinofuranosidase
MKLYRDHFAPNLLELTGDPARLSAIATKSADGKRVVLKMTNPTDKAMDVKLAVNGNFKSSQASFQIVAPDDLSARNTMDKRDAVRVVEAKVARAGNNVSFSMPRWSVGVVELAN